MSQIQITGEAKIRDLQGPVVANSGVITALDGLPSQYVRGDGTLADIPSVTGGGASVSYYLNGSVNQGTFGGSTYYQLGENAITGVGTNFSTSTNGLLAQFITDADVPDVTEIPSGNWNIEFYMGVSASSGALASFYVEIYKYDGTTFTLIASNVATPEVLTNTTTIDAYFTSVAMPLTSLAVTDRIAIRVYANVAGKTVTMYTEDNRLCQVVTTFSRGMLSLNSLTDQQQYLTVGTAGTDFNIVSSVDTHTFNIPTASSTKRGALSSTDWSTFNNKVPYTGATGDVNLGLYDLYLASVFAQGTLLSNQGLRIEGDGINDGGNIQFKQYPSVTSGTLGYTTLSANDSTSFNIFFNQPSSSDYKNVKLNSGLLTNNVIRTYSFPDLSGTIALLEGSQTFTGTKTFSADPIITSTTSAYLQINSATGNTSSVAFTVNNANVGFIDVNASQFSFRNYVSNQFRFVDGFMSNGGILAMPSASLQTYTFPASSGTVALTSNLSAYLPLTGGTLTGTLNGTFGIFSVGVYGFGLQAQGDVTNAGVLQLKHTGSVSVSSGNVAIAADSANTIGFYFAGSSTAKLSNASLTATRTYTLPDASGTIALTSNLSSYVPYTGATANVELGNYRLIAGSIFATPTSGEAQINFKQTTTGNTIYDGHSSIWSTGTNLYIATSAPSSTSKSFYFNLGSLTSGTTRNYTLPDTNGTIALTSNLSSYLPLSGGTLTGALSGTSATFSGNLGIGVSASSDTLNVLGTNNNNAAYFLGGATIGQSFGLQIRAGSSITDYSFLVQNRAGSDYFRIRGDGNVGIGTSSPARTLHVLGQTGIGTVLKLEGAAGTTTYLQLAYNGATNVQSGYIGYDSSANMSFFTNDTERMRITSGGNAQIGGTTGSDSRLYIKGVSSTGFNNALLIHNSSSSDLMYIRNDGYINTGLASFSPYNFSTSGRSAVIDSAGGFGYLVSTRESKANIKSIKNVDFINQLNPVQFNYRKKDNLTNEFTDELYDNITYGFIADEVEQVNKELVMYNQDGALGGVEYNSMIAILTKAIQEQNEIITKQGQAINELKALIAAK